MPLYQFQQHTFDSDRGTLQQQQSDGSQQQQTLRHKVALLLEYLLQRPEQIISKDELLSALWRHGDYRENSLTQSIRELRLALGDNAQAPRFIKTFPQRGYQWLPAVSAVELQPQQTQPQQTRPIATTDTPPTGRYQRWRPVSVLLLLAIMLIGLAVSFWPQRQQAGDQGSASLLVLPFINATQDHSMKWLELGLADMIAIDLKRQQQLSVVSPVRAQGLIHQAGLIWPTLPVHIRSLLQDQQLDAALFASVRLVDQHQVMDFQLIYRNGKQQQGSIAYPSLPAQVGAISVQLQQLLLPHQPGQRPAAEDSLAARALAQGMQAVRTQGSHQARRYFQAALLIEPAAHWTRAWLAYSELELGQWPQAEASLQQIPASAYSQDISLQAFVTGLQAKLAHRRGGPEAARLAQQALSDARRAQDQELQKEAMVLLANQAWDQFDWQQHQQWLQQLQPLLAGDPLLRQADQLFYLGSPANSGLERSPLIDAASNAERLQQALNYYRQLGIEPQIAATQLALAQNDSLAEQPRRRALQAAIDGYRQLQLPYELFQALSYAGFFEMQWHRGEQAEPYFHQAAAIAEQLGSARLQQQAGFYLAFARLDQGLDLSALGLHGQRTEVLDDAIQRFNRLQLQHPYLQISRLLFLGWAHLDAGRFRRPQWHWQQAEHYLQQALQHPAIEQLETTRGYVSYSLMRTYLQQQKYQQVEQLAETPFSTRLQAIYAARAFYQQGHNHKAAELLLQLKQQFPHSWLAADEQRLQQYRTTSAADTSLSDEVLPHYVYCEQGPAGFVLNR